MVMKTGAALKKTLITLTLSVGLSVVVFMAVVTPALFFSSPAAYAQSTVTKNYPTFVLPYRSNNRWVHQQDKDPLDALTRYAQRENIYSFSIILPENSDNNVYIERLLVLSRIMKSRLKRDTIVFRQELGTTPPNTISVTPSDGGTTTD